MPSVRELHTGRRAGNSSAAAWSSAASQVPTAPPAAVPPIGPLDGPLTCVAASSASCATTVHGWHIYRETEDETPNQKPKMTFTVRAVGTAVVHSVQVRVAGARNFKPQSTSLFQPYMGAGSEPIVVAVRLWTTKPEPESESEACVEIIWTRLRPYREYGRRVKARSMDWEERRRGSIRLRPRPDGGWWTRRALGGGVLGHQSEERVRAVAVRLPQHRGRLERAHARGQYRAAVGRVVTSEAPSDNGDRASAVLADPARRDRVHAP